MSRIKVALVDRNLAAIVCVHVAKDGRAILIAERAAPEDSADSGWQFCCGEGNEKWEQAQVWSIQEVLDLEPSLNAFVDLPADITLTRVTAGDGWQEGVS